MFRLSVTFCVFALSLASISGAHAQRDSASSAATAASPATYPVLSIPLPPNARLRVDLDAQDEDVLGVTKSLLRGFNGANLKQLLPSPSADPKSSRATPDASVPAMLSLLSDADLATLLENVHHLRVVFFETPFNSTTATRKSASQAVLNYYLQAYVTREGGRRVMRADFDDVQALAVNFEDRRFAFVFQAPGFGAVVRADGYPNLESVGPIALALALYGVRGSAGPAVRTE